MSPEDPPPALAPLYPVDPADGIVRKMCGRYVITPDPETIARFFGADEIVATDLGPNYNVAPTDQIYGIAEHHGQRLLGEFRWGLIPWWTKETGPLHINARSETVATKPAFRDAFSRRRCLIPADGFYEWEARQDGKQPYFIHSDDGAMVAFAGLWSRWKDPDTGEILTTAAIITTAAEGAVAGLHDRMPVILPPDLWEAWLDRELTDPDEVERLLQAAGNLEFHPVSRIVNSVKNNSPECVMPISQ